MLLSTHLLRRQMSVTVTPATRIKVLMSQDELTQRELSAKLKVDESLISKYLSPKGNPSDKFVVKLETVLRWSARWIRTGEGPQRLPTLISNESVNVSQPGKRNQSNVNYKGTQANEVPTDQDEITRLKLQLQEEKIRSLEREKELLEEMNRLLKERQK